MTEKDNVPLAELLDAPDAVNDTEFVALTVYVPDDEDDCVAPPDCVLVTVIEIEVEAEPLEERQRVGEGVTDPHPEVDALLRAVTVMLGLDVDEYVGTASVAVLDTVEIGVRDVERLMLGEGLVE